jgi:hypothetical protein
MKAKITSMLVFWCAASGSFSIAGEPEYEKAAVAAAEKWVALVDGEKYAESWQETAELFRNAVTQGQWVQGVKSTRQPLGNLLGRKLKNATYKTSLPGAPDGAYVVIQFESSFEHKQTATETITPMLEKDGSWRVSGYYIQ